MQEGLPTFLSTGKETLQSEARHKGASTITVILSPFYWFEWYNTEERNSLVAMLYTVPLSVKDYLGDSFELTQLFL